MVPRLRSLSVIKKNAMNVSVANKNILSPDVSAKGLDERPFARGDYMNTLQFIKVRFVMSALFAAALALAGGAAAQDFTLTLEPNSLTLIPGQSASFVISMAPIGGFNQPVTLSVSNLPPGVTASFSPQTLTPPGTSVLSLTATTNAVNGSFLLGLSATGGGITNTVSSSVLVSFGLLPICTGAFQGTITDIQTGLPVPYAEIDADGYFVLANASGQFLMTNLALGSSENLPVDYNIVVNRSNYWASYTNAYAVCDATNIVNVQILLEQEGSITGVLTAEGGQPLTNVTIVASYQNYYYATTGTNGAFQFESLGLANNNGPANYTISVEPAGYWEVVTNVLVQANSNAVLNLVAIHICHATVSGSVIYADTGLPATNVAVSISSSGTVYTTTDSEGNYTATNVALGIKNVPINGSVEASAAGYYTGYTNIALSDCNQSLGAPTLRLVPIPVVHNNYGAITGLVLDVQTGLPISNVYVYTYGSGGAYTDSNGDYVISNVFVGSGAQTNGDIGVYTQANNYFGSSSNVVVDAGETSTLNFNLLRIAYGVVEGTVLNAATGLPVAGVSISGITGVTGADGHYISNPIQLESGNLPTPYGYSAYETGYYTTYTNTTLTNGVTNVVNIELIQVCTGATIVGNVVNALTEQPITNATITIYSSQYLQTMTDTNGNFILTNVTVGNDNSPIATTLTATAPGFNPQTKTVTIFCDATISTEFGAPETAFGEIEGYVTNVLTGLPLTNIFIGSSFGEATYTDSNGFYTLTQAPLGAAGANRTWTVTATPSGYPPQTKSVVVSSNVISQLDFGFGQPPTTLVVSATGAPDPVTVGSNLVYTVTLTNSVAAAANVLLADTLPPGVTFVSASNSTNPGGAFSAPILTNGMVTTLATNLSSNSITVLLITVIPNNTGIITNNVAVSSDTPEINPAGTNLTATVVTTVVAPAAPPTELIVTMQASPTNVITVGSNLVYSITLTNTIATATNVELLDTLPPAVEYLSAAVSNLPGANFSQPVFAAGVVTISSASFSSNSAVTLLITVTPSVGGDLTNAVKVTSGTTNLAPGSVLSASAISAALADADLALILSENTNSVTRGSNISYTLVVTNLGPANAPDVQVDDTLPAGVVFVSATASQGTANSTQGGAHWDFGALSSHGALTGTLIVTPSALGLITNSAIVTLVTEGVAVVDPNLSNNTASVVATVIPPVTNTPPPPQNLTAKIGPIVFNPQTGLYQQTLLVTNLTGVALTAVRITVLSLPSTVLVYNAAGMTNGQPYVEYDQTVAVGGNVSFLLQYYVATRQSFTSTNFLVTAVAAATPASATGTVLQLDRKAFMSEGQLTIEFASVPGHTYVVQYSSDMETWLTAAPPIVAKNTKTQWIDAGPPSTDSPPDGVASRFYRIIQTN